MQEDEVFVPEWHPNGGHNDRFAMMHAQNASTWAQRLQFGLDYCTTWPMHSETYVKLFAKHNALKVTPWLVTETALWLLRTRSLEHCDPFTTGFDWFLVVTDCTF